MAVQEAIANYLVDWATAQMNPKFAVLIDGAWGSGKTHFVKSLINNDSFDTKKVIYISVFGIANTEDLNTQIFLASTSKLGSFGYHGAGIASSAVKFISGIDINGDGKNDATLNTNFSGLQSIIKNSLTKINNSIIIIDDLERCKIEPAELLGAINQLVEHSDARMLLVANEAKIENKDFLDFQEKVVGQKFTLECESSNAFSAFIEEIGNQECSQIILKHKDRILKLVDQSGYQNLRVLRQYIFLLNRLFIKLDPEHLRSEIVQNHLIAESWVFFVEFKLNLSDTSKNLKIQDLRNEYSQDDPETRIVMDIDLLRKDDEPKKPKQLILEKYKYWSGINTILRVETWIVILKTGVIAAEQLNDDLSTSELVIGTSS